MNTYPKFKVFTSDDPSKLDREESLTLKESTYFPKDKTAKIIALKSLKSRNFKDLSFTNYLSSNECKEYNILKKV
ncbi:hypothetical protein AGMMS49532_00540 [Endomicrobiia bacterium]|nr:hypothetical protein AGMMS49532_00540 [Endomicrobiia bacterium]